MSTTETITKQGIEHKIRLQQVVERLDQIANNLVGTNASPEDPEISRENNYGFFNICLGLQTDYHSLWQVINNQLSLLEDHLGIGGRETVSTAPPDPRRFREKLLSGNLAEAIAEDLRKGTFRGSPPIDKTDDWESRKDAERQVPNANR